MEEMVSERRGREWRRWGGEKGGGYEGDDEGKKDYGMEEIHDVSIV
jgi:hypothetical protein